MPGGINPPVPRLIRGPRYAAAFATWPASASAPAWDAGASSRGWRPFARIPTRKGSRGRGYQGQIVDVGGGGLTAVRVGPIVVM